MDQNLTDDRTTVGSHDDRSSGGVFLMPSERRMREAVSIQPHARTLACAKPISRFGHCSGSIHGGAEYVQQANVRRSHIAEARWASRSGVRTETRKEIGRLA